MKIKKKGDTFTGKKQKKNTAIQGIMKITDTSEINFTNWLS